MTATLIGNCVNCGHDQTKHKGIDGGLRLASRCTDHEIDSHATEVLGRTVKGPLLCRCRSYETKSKDRK